LVNKPFQNSLGVEFRKLRKRTRLTQATVATTAGISLPAIRKLERGLGNLATWTKALNASGGRFVVGISPPEIPSASR
jgi:transcriptional regulator with XRE-family HTH domain